MRRALALACVLGGVLLTTAARADYKTDYQDGVEAAQKGDWAKVRQLMQKALAQEQTPVARMRTYGTNYIPYVPHHYLGLALARLDDCQGALTAFNNPANKSVIAKLSKEGAAQTQQATRCEQVMLAQQKPPEPPPTTPTDTKPPTTPVVIADTTPPKPPVDKPPVTPPAPPGLDPARLAPATDAIARVDKLIAGIDQRLRAAPIAGSGDANALKADLNTLREQRTRHSGGLARARATADLALAKQVEADAGKLERSLKTLGERVDSAAKGLAEAQEARALAQAQARVQPALAGLDKALADAASNGLTAAATSRATTLRASLQTAATLTERRAIERLLTDAAKAVDDLGAAIAAAPKPAPEQLRILVSWYLAADYEQAARWNAIQSLPDDRARAQAHLVRAASRWHLYVRRGEQDSTLGAAVEADLRDAKRLDKTLKPNTAAFSPKLLQRFASL